MINKIISSNISALQAVNNSMLSIEGSLKKVYLAIENISLGQKGDKEELLNSLAFLHNLQSKLSQTEGELLYFIGTPIIENNQAKPKPKLSVVDINRESDDNPR